MSNKKENTLELIAQVDSEDLARARSEVADAIQRAQDAWIPGHLIASALALELQSFLTANEPPDNPASILRRLADHLESFVPEIPEIH